MIHLAKLLLVMSLPMQAQILLTMLGTVSDLTLSTVKPTDCTPPPSFTSFSPADQKIFAYFTIRGLLSPNVSARWIRVRDENWFATTTWSGGHDGCFLGAAFDFNWLSPSDYGDWRIDVYIDTSRVASRAFTIAGAAAQDPSNGYVGYFDGTDCNHLWGWAYDPGSTQGR